MLTYESEHSGRLIGQQQGTCPVPDFRSEFRGASQTEHCGSTPPHNLARRWFVDFGNDKIV